MRTRIQVDMVRFASVILFSALALSLAAGSDAEKKNNKAAQSDPPARIVAPSSSYKFPNGQKLIYAADWHFLNAGTASIQWKPAANKEKLTADANSTGAVNLLFPVKDLFEASVDPKTFCSTQVFKHAEEGKHKLEMQLRMDAPPGKAVMDVKNLKTGETKHEENDAPACSTDILSGFFYLGSLPLASGMTETVPVTDGGKTSIVLAQVEGPEQVKVPAGNFQTLRVAVEAISGKFKGKGKLLVWYSNDAHHTPVQMRAKLPYGTVMFKLQRTEQ